MKRHCSVIKLIAIFLLLVFPTWVKAEKILTYRTYEPQTGKVIQEFSATIKDLPGGGQAVVWVIDEPDNQVKEEYILDRASATKSWWILDPGHDTNYRGERRRDTLSIKGRFYGKQVNRKLKIDQRPFYFNPKFGLRQFVLSGEKVHKFWALRNDELSHFLMVATREGEESVTIGGQEVPAVRIYWTLGDFRSLFFKRRYWFRKSDGLYIRQEVEGGHLRELVGESGNLRQSKIKRGQ